MLTIKQINNDPTDLEMFEAREIGGAALASSAGIVGSSGDTVARKVMLTHLRMAALIGVVLACTSSQGLSRDQPSRQKEAAAMNPATTLETLLESANWDAVDEAQREGPLALPAVRHYAASSNYRTRQIATACAARIGGAEATAILASALADPNINVQLTAAKEFSPRGLSRRCPADPGSAGGQSSGRYCPRISWRWAGRVYSRRGLSIHPSPTIPGLGCAGDERPDGPGSFGRSRARHWLEGEFASPTPRTRYDALDQLRYVGDRSLIAEAKKLLGDREPARRIGTARHPHFRRVCDQAVDTVVFLLNLRFPADPEKIYSDEELRRVRELAG